MVYNWGNLDSKDKNVRSFAWAAGDVVLNMGMRDAVSKIDIISETRANCVFVRAPFASGKERDKLVLDKLGEAKYTKSKVPPKRALLFSLSFGSVLVDVDGAKYFAEEAKKDTTGLDVAA